MAGKGCDCGELKRQSDDEEVLPTESPESLITRVALHCDNDTGVFFFRYKGKLYLRVVEC